MSKNTVQRLTRASFGLSYLFAIAAFTVNTNLFAGAVALCCCVALLKQLEQCSPITEVSVFLQTLIALITVPFLGNFVGVFVTLTAVGSLMSVVTMCLIFDLLKLKKPLNPRSTVIISTALIAIITFRTDGAFLPNDVLPRLHDALSGTPPAPAYSESLQYLSLWGGLALVVELTVIAAGLLSKMSAASQES